MSVIHNSYNWFGNQSLMVQKEVIALLTPIYQYKTGQFNWPTDLYIDTLNLAQHPNLIRGSHMDV